MKPAACPPSDAAGLADLHRAIEARVADIRARHPDWPCSKGCDRCCRSLAGIPALTPPEWALLCEALAQMDTVALDVLRTRVADLGRQPGAPYVCPLLDAQSGACPVYLQRPVACRTYGFYQSRDKGLYCATIESQVAAGALDAVVWGNHAAVEDALARKGEARPLTVWMAQWQPHAAGLTPDGATARVTG